MFTFTSNISFYTVPIAFMIAQSGGIYSKQVGREILDMVHPRDYLNEVAKSQKLDEATKKRIIRAEAAEANSLTTLALFGPAVVAANIASVPVDTINKLAVSYLVLRASYVVLYIWVVKSLKFVPLRALTHWGSVAVAMSLYILAGRNM